MPGFLSAPPFRRRTSRHAIGLRGAVAMRVPRMPAPADDRRTCGKHLRRRTHADPRRRHRFRRSRPGRRARLPPQVLDLRVTDR
ncbi:hypothetical protein DM52_2848 [Burkholderia mallei]|nr:hypothetical protein DM52_2848 [Burkholderia mallei]